MPKNKKEEVIKRKVVILLVEGKSDKTALNLIEKFYTSKNIKVYTTDGDITSNFLVTYTNCVEKLSEKIESIRDDMKLKRDDIYEVIHLIDTDGAFIPDSCIVVDRNIKEFYYTLDCIKSNSKNKVIKRNNDKIGKIRVLLNTKKVDEEIKYRIFYMSCNLDHVLFNEMNLSNDKKVEKAFEFRRTYQNNKEGFINFFNSEGCKANGDYNTTWNFIQKDKNSLHRYNNLYIFLNELEEENS
ncbi:hypothetical protein [Fusobacterium perfoetens]|uniref:hypothetical protein n=1 Tax=Fusobacterium perfoetens TaxID=852 RepID=UPI0004818A2D|nr:hypothetical protein [Fusobacterium perfoetens]